jgi:hypothetical protein
MRVMPTRTIAPTISSKMARTSTVFPMLYRPGETVWGSLLSLSPKLREIIRKASKKLD